MGNGVFAGWRFAGELRHSQLVIIDAVAGADAGADADRIDPLHIVAPPGSGKTLVGLELVMRRGARTLVLAPTTTIRAQWARTARSLAAGSWGDSSPEAPSGAVSEDPGSLGDVTVLTYQMLSVLETSSPFDELAAREWIAELVEAGRTPEAAEAWLADLARSNRVAHTRGLRRRAGKLRKEAVRADPADLLEALHPNARALIDRIVAHGVTTLVLDECHHLLDHWAVVVHALVGRIRESGAEPLIIGLTATLPSIEDRESYENYTGLLGDVDYELPTPAVVKEGNLAPYQDFAWFVRPTPEELLFVRKRDAGFEELVTATLATTAGIEFLESLLGGNPQGRRTKEIERSLAEAFAVDFQISEAALSMLADLKPKHPIVVLGISKGRSALDTEQRVRLLARYMLERVLPFPECAELWQRSRALLADLGFHLTDRGVRRGRDPIDQVLSTSHAKDLAVGQILRAELASDTGDRVRAVVLVDFAVYGHGSATKGQRAGALRCFDTVVADQALAGLCPVLVTSQHLRIPERDAGVLLPRLAELLGVAPDALRSTSVPDPEGGSSQVLAVDAEGVGSAAVVAAVSKLVEEGTVRLIVGTRGLLGEGWDCPAVNTLIDLSVAATSTATQQLRGRTLRLDPAWREKVAHNWTVTCVLEADFKLDGLSDLRRLYRKHNQVWGLTREEPTAIVRGMAHTLSDVQFSMIKALVSKRFPVPQVAGLNSLTLVGLTSRAATREKWGIGEPYSGEERSELVTSKSKSARYLAGPVAFEVVVGSMLTTFFGGMVLAFFGVFQATSGNILAATLFSFVGGVILCVTSRGLLRQVWQSARRFSVPGVTQQSALYVIARVCAERGLLPKLGRANIVLESIYTPQRVIAFFEITIRGCSPQEQRLVLSAFEEMLTPVRSPRFLLEVGAPPRKGATLLSRIASGIARLLGGRTRLLPVPTVIGRRRADAEMFAKEWAREIGPCRLHELNSPEKLRLLTRARKMSGASEDETKTLIREVWA